MIGHSLQIPYYFNDNTNDVQAAMDVCIFIICYILKERHMIIAVCKAGCSLCGQDCKVARIYDSVLHAFVLHLEIL